MSGKAEFFRQEIPPHLLKHSVNQQRIKYMRGGEERTFGKRNKATIAEKRRVTAEKRQHDFSNNFPRAQFERSLRNVFNGGATLENIIYVMRQITKFEEQVEVDDGVEITMINLLRE